MYELVPVYFWSILEPELARFWRWYWLARFKADVMVAPEKGRGRNVKNELDITLKERVVNYVGKVVRDVGFSSTGQHE